MNTIEISSPNRKKETYSAPASWDELSTDNLLYWSRICLQKITLAQAKYLAAFGLYQIPKKAIKALKDGQLTQIGNTLDFLFERNKLQKWVMKSFRYGLFRYYGPSDYLSNLTIGEYRQTEISYQSYLKTGDRRHLVVLMAILYRRKRKGRVINDIREDLTEFGTRNRCTKFENLSPEYLHTCLLNYEGCRSYLIEKYAEVFTSTNSATAEIVDLETVIEALAGDKFGTFSETEKTNLHRFFRHLVTSIKRAQESQKLAS